MKTLKERRKKKREKKREKNTELHLNEAIARVEELEAQLEVIKKIKNRRPAHEIKIEPRHKSGTSEAVVIAVASDWHFGQKITREQTNGLNEFDIGTGQSRAALFFERLVRLTNKERQDVKIDELVLFLGGDFIEGSLHLDTIMGSDLPLVMKQVTSVEDVLFAGLRFIEKHGDFKRVTVVCADGNHGRVTVKQHHHSRQGNAVEYILYYMLAQKFPKFTWIIEESMLTYVSVYDAIIRFMHGDRIAFGGVNGFYTYLHRRIYEWDTSRRADFTVLGHLHQYTPGRRYLVNGSLCGYNAFAISLGARFEPPTQAFMLFDRDRGPTVQIPILLTERKDLKRKAK